MLRGRDMVIGAFVRVSLIPYLSNPVSRVPSGWGYTPSQVRMGVRDWRSHAPSAPRPRLSFPVSGVTPIGVVGGGVIWGGPPFTRRLLPTAMKTKQKQKKQKKETKKKQCKTKIANPASSGGTVGTQRGTKLSSPLHAVR